MNALPFKSGPGIGINHMTGIPSLCLRCAKIVRMSSLLGLFVGFAGGLGVTAETAQAEPDDWNNIRHVYVPVENLDVVVHQDRFGALLPVEEFETLLRNARELSEQQSHQPRTPVLSNSRYQARIDGKRIVADLELELATFARGANEFGFRIGGWNVEQALWREAPAIVSRTGKDGKTLRVLIDGTGQHRLQLRLSTPLQAVSSDQVAKFDLAAAPSGEFEIELPAGKHLTVNRRALDRPAPDAQPARYAIPIGGQPWLEIRITDRKRTSRADVLTFANTTHGIRVEPSEITWIARTDLEVFGRSMDRLICGVPRSLEITGVQSNGLESWELDDDPDDNTTTRLTLQYRQSFEGSRTILFRGILGDTPNEPWSVPNLTLGDVTAHVGVILVQYPDNVRLQVLDSSGVRTVSEQVNPQGVLEGGIGARFQAWEEDFDLRFVAELKQQEVQAAMTNVLDLHERGLDLYTTVDFQTRLAPLFDGRIRLPAEWQVTAVTVDGTPATWEIVPQIAGVNEIRIPFSSPLTPGQNRSIALISQSQPDLWPVADTPVRLALPEIRLPQAAMVEALYGITAAADLDVIPVDVTGLDPARTEDVDLLNQKLQGLGKQVRLGFTYQDTLFSGQLDVVRKIASLVAEMLTFFRVDEETLFTRWEANLNLTGGGVRTLRVNVSESAGADLRFRLVPRGQNRVDGKIIEQTAADPVDGVRTWTLLFDRYLTGDFLLWCELRLPRGDEEESFSPPMLTLPDSQTQSGHVACEASPEEHLRITATGADGQSLKLVDPVDFPRGAYQPRKRVVAGYQYIQPGWNVAVSTTRFDRAAVPTAVVHLVNLKSVLSKAGEFQHRSDLNFTAYGAQSLIVQLPRATKLWSTLLDGEPVEVRRSENGVQVPLGSGDDADRRTLSVLYSTRGPSLETLGELQTSPPQVSVLDGAGNTQPIEVLKYEWTLNYPNETLLVSSPGTFQPVIPLFQETILGRITQMVSLPTAGSLWNRAVAVALALGFFWFLGRIRLLTAAKGCSFSVLGAAALVVVCCVVLIALMLPAVQHAREAARRSPAVNSYFATQTGEAFEADSEAPMEMTDDFLASSDEGRPASQRFDKEFAQEKELSGALEEQLHESEGVRRRLLERQMGRFTTPAPANEPAAPPTSETAPGLAGEPAAGTTPGYPGGVPDMNIPSRQGSFDFAAPKFGNQISQPQSPTVDFDANGTMRSESRQSQQFEGGAMGGFGGGGGPSDRAWMQLQDPAGYGMGVFDSESNFSGTWGTQAAGQIGQADRLAILGGALLSMTFDLQVPDDSRSHKFTYQGNTAPIDGTDLRVRFASRNASRMLVCVIALGVALLGWWIRSAPAPLRAGYLFITVINPLAFAAIAPTMWHLVLEGLLFGGLAALTCWGLRFCVANCCGRLSELSKQCWKKAAMCLILPGTFAMMSQETWAEEPVPPPVPSEKEPYVIVPYELEQGPRAAERVWIPQQTYRALWQAAHPEDVDPVDEPREALIAEALYAARLSRVGEETQLAISARWVIVSRTSAKMTVSLPVRHVAVDDVILDGAPAPVVPGRNGKSALVVSGRGHHVVDAQLRIQVDAIASAGRFQLTLEPVGTGTLSVELPDSEDELQVRVNGVTDVFRRIETAEASSIEIPIDQGGRIDVSWRPEQLMDEQDNFLQLESGIAAVFDDVGLHALHGFLLRVRQGAVNDFSFDIPEGVSIRQITGEDIGGWEIDQSDQTHRLNVFFRRRIDNETRFRIALFQSVSEEANSHAVPLLVPLNTARETGYVGLYAAPHLRLRPGTVTGAGQIDLAQYQPAEHPGPQELTPQFAYRFSARPVSVVALVNRRQTESRILLHHGVSIEPRKTRIASLIRNTITGSPRRFLKIHLPEGYLPVDVASQYAVDWYVSSNEDGATLAVELDQPRVGTIEIALEGFILKAPDATEVTLDLPEPVDESRRSVSLGVWLDEVYEATINSMQGWRSVSPDQLPNQITALQSRPAQFAFTSTNPSADPVELQLQQATPELSVDAVTLIAVSDATIDYGFTFRWNISRAATDELMFTAPEWLGALEFNGPGIRQVRSEALGDGTTRWSISLVDPIREQYLITAAATIAAPADLLVRTPMIGFVRLDTGGTLAPIETQRVFAILVNLSGNQLVPGDIEQFESVAVDALPLAVHQQLVQQATEITRVRTGRDPQWTIERTQAISGTQAVVVAANLQTVLELDGSWRTRASYAIRNRGRQFLALRVPEASRILSVFVRGEASRTVTTTIDGELVDLIALPQTSAADLSFDVELILTGQLEMSLPTGFTVDSQHLKLPVPQVVSQEESGEFGLTVAQTLWTVHLSEDLDVAPVSGTQATNLTWHDTGPTWLAAEMQTLQRFKADIAEMKRIATSESFSVFQRRQARDNLRQLGQALEQQVQSLETSSEAVAGGSYRSFFDDNRDLYADTQVELQELDELDSLAKPPAFGNAGREFIIGNNAMIQNSNTAGGLSFQKGQPPATFNFYGIEDARRGGEKAESAAAKDSLARNKLKSQIAGQGLMLQQDPSVSFTIPNGDALSLPAIQDGAALDGIEQRGVRIQLGEDVGDRAGVPLYQRGEVAIEGQEALLAAGIAPQVWDTAGGLSVAMQIPVSGQKFSFSKVGGNPELTLAIRPKETWSLGIAAVWCVAFLGIGGWVLVQFAGALTIGKLFDSLGLIALCIGLAGFFLLPVEVRWLFFTLFCFGCLIRVARVKPTSVW